MAAPVNVEGDKNQFRSGTGPVSVSPYLNSGDWIVDIPSSPAVSASNPLITLGAAFAAALLWRHLA